jgi:hypothetical protein
MIVNPERANRILSNLTLVVSDLSAASQESKTDGTLKQILFFTETALAGLRFYIATK